MSPVEGGSRSNLWSAHKVIISILLVAFGLRLYWLLTHSSVINIEGSEYVRMAINLRESHRLLSSWGTPETMYAPLYSILIAALSVFGIPVEIAAHGIAVLSGVALVFVLYLLTRHVYGEPAASFCATLAAIHPLFVSLSAGIYSESVYLTLWVTAVYFGVRALDTFSGVNFALTGFWIGLAYLTRPEAFAYPLFFALAAWTMAILRRRSLVGATRGAALVLGTYVLVASPYVVFLDKTTGHLRLEGKWNINYTIGNRIDQGMSFWQAAYAVGDDTFAQGPLLDPFRFAAFTPYPHGLRDKMHYFYSRSRANWRGVYFILSTPAFGSPFLLLLVVLGLFSAPWDADRLAREFVLLTMALSIVVLLASAHEIEDRYSYPFVPLATIWAGNGLVAFVSWIRETRKALGVSWLPDSRRVAVGGTVVLYALVLSASYIGTDRDVGFSDEAKGADSRSVKQAGLWLREHGGFSARVCAINSRLPYYAHATLVQFPYADSLLTIRYLKSQNAGYLALDSSYSHVFPTIGQWLADGIPDPGAQLIYDTGSKWKERIEIYRLTAPSTNSVVNPSANPRHDSSERHLDNGAIR